MARLRGALGPIVLVWLVCQTATLTLVPAALALELGDAASQCACTDGPDAMCPMHHHPVAGSQWCAQGMTTNAAAVLSSLIAAVGLIPLSAPAIDVAPTTSVACLDASMNTGRPVPPDPPPPRA